MKTELKNAFDKIVELEIEIQKIKEYIKREQSGCEHEIYSVVMQHPYRTETTCRKCGLKDTVYGR